MTPMHRPTLRFQGTGPALVTPLDSRGEVDHALLAEHVERCVAGGVDFLVPCGTTGESATLSAAEQRQVVRTTVKVAASRVPVLAGAGSNATAVAVQLAEGAKEEGADGLLVVTPYYNKPSPAGLELHYRAVARVGLPIVLYNVPGRTGANVVPEVVFRLAAAIPEIVGIKEAAGRIDQVMELVARRPEGFAVLSGDDDLAVAAAAVGADGLISVVANEAPGPTSAMVRAAREGRMEEARTLLYRLLPLMGANFAESNPGPVKAALEILGHAPAHLREPLAPVLPETRARLVEALRHAGLLSDSASTTPTDHAS